ETTNLQLAERYRKEAEASKMMKVSEACTYLGGISPQTLNTYMKRGLPYYKKGQSVLYQKGDIDQWLSSGKVNRHSR
ncbi:MAG: DNA-binding protein, partial [Cytophagaceae bacterium]